MDPDDPPGVQSGASYHQFNKTHESVDARLGFVDEEESDVTGTRRLTTMDMLEQLAHCGDMKCKVYTPRFESIRTSNVQKNKNMTLTPPYKMLLETPNGKYMTERSGEKEDPKDYHNDTENDTELPSTATTGWINVINGIHQCLDRLKQIRVEFFYTEDHEQDECDQRLEDETDERDTVIDHGDVMHDRLDFPRYDRLSGSNSNYINDMCLQSQRKRTWKLFTDNINMYSESESSTITACDYDDTIQQTPVVLVELDSLDNYAFNYESDEDKLSPAKYKTELGYEIILDNANDSREQLSAIDLTSDLSIDASFELEDNTDDVDTYFDEDAFVGNNDNGITGDNSNDDGLYIVSDVNEDLATNFELASIQRAYSLPNKVSQRYEFSGKPDIGKSFTDRNETNTLCAIYDGQVSLTPDCYVCVHKSSGTYNTFNFGPINEPNCKRIWIYIPELNDAPLENYTDWTASVEFNDRSDDVEYMLGVDNGYYKDATTIVEKWCEDVDNAGRCDSNWMKILNDAISALDADHRGSDFRNDADDDDDCHEKEDGKDGDSNDYIYMYDLETFYDGDDEDGESLLDDSKLMDVHNDANVKEPKIVRRAQTVEESATDAFKYTNTCVGTEQISRYDDGSSDELNINAATQWSHLMTSDYLGGKAGNKDKMEPDTESSSSELDANRKVLEVDGQCDQTDIVYRTVVNKCNTYNSKNDIKHLPMSVYNSVVNVYNFVEAEMLGKNICAGVKEGSQERIDKEEIIDDDECMYPDACEVDITLDKDMYQEDSVLYNTPATGSVTEEDIDDEIVVNTVIDIDTRSQDEQYQTCCFPLILFGKKPREMQTVTADRKSPVWNRTIRHSVDIQSDPDHKTHAKRPGWGSRILHVFRHEKKSKR